MDGAEKIVVFKYDSTDPKFFGTKIVCSRLSDFHFNVEGFYTMYKVYDVTGGVVSPLKGPSTVVGTLTSYFKERSDEKKLEIGERPFDIRLYAYCPKEDKKYEAGIYGIEIVRIKDKVVCRGSKEQTADFVACNVLNWQ